MHLHMLHISDMYLAWNSKTGIHLGAVTITKLLNIMQQGLTIPYA